MTTESSKYLEASKTIAELLLKMEEHFLVDSRDFNIDLDETVGCVFTITFNCEILAEHKYSDADFRLFCNKNDLVGVIFFETGNKITFSMTPLVPKENLT